MVSFCFVLPSPSLPYFISSIVIIHCLLSIPAQLYVPNMPPHAVNSRHDCLCIDTSITTLVKPTHMLLLIIVIIHVANNCKVDDDYFPIVESAMEDSREALQRFCSQDSTADPRLPPMNLNDSVSLAQCFSHLLYIGLTGSVFFLFFNDFTCLFFIDFTRFFA